MSNLIVPRYRAMDNTGAPINGAKLYFYRAGTLTAQNTYPTYAAALAGTGANANPVVADANGWFGRIFLDPDLHYKAKLTDAAGVEIWTCDNIDAAEFATSALAVRVKQIASNPLDYGAIGDGVADESSMVQDAIDAATGVVDLLGKTYRCDSTITLRSGITLQNGTLDFTNSTDTSGVLISGTVGSPLDVDTGGTCNRRVLTLDSVTGLTVGDYVAIKCTVGVGGAQDNQVNRIIAIDGGTKRITFAYPLNTDNYADAANAATVTKLTAAEDVGLSHVTVISGTGIWFSATVEYAADVLLEHCIFSGIGQAAGVMLGYSSNVTISDCEVRGRGAASTYGIGAEGPNRNITIKGCDITDIQYGVIFGNVAGTYGEGISYGCLVTDCSIVTIESTDYTGIESTVDGGCFDLTVIDCNIEAPIGVENTIGELKVANCRIISVDATSYCIKHTPNWHGWNYAARSCLDVHDCELSTQKYGVWVYQPSAAGLPYTPEIHDVRIASNTFIGPYTKNLGDSAIYINTAADIAITGNNTRDHSTSVTILECNRLAIFGNIFQSTIDPSPTQNIVAITCNTAAVGFVICGNIFKGTTTPGDCLNISGDHASDVSNVSINGNVFVGGRYGINVSNCAEIIHDGNDFSGQTTGITNGGFTTAGDTA